MAGEAVSAQPARPHSPKTCHRRAAQSPDAAGSRFPRPGAWQPFDGLTRSSKLPGEPGITPSPHGQLKLITSPDRAAWVGSAPLDGCEFGEAEARTEVCTPRFGGTPALLAPASVPPAPRCQSSEPRREKAAQSKELTCKSLLGEGGMEQRRFTASQQGTQPSQQLAGRVGQPSVPRGWGFQAAAAKDECLGHRPRGGEQQQGSVWELVPPGSVSAQGSREELHIPGRRGDKGDRAARQQLGPEPGEQSH